MRKDVTRQPAWFIIAQFFVLSCCIWLRYFLYPSGGGLTGLVPAAGDGMPLGVWINSLAARFPYAGHAAFMLFVVLNAFIITRTLSRNLVYQTRNYLPAIFYLVVCCGIFTPAWQLASVMAAYLLTKASTLFISSFVRTTSFAATFRAAILTGSAMLLHAPAVIYILLVPIAMRVFRRNPRETAVAVFGALLPVLVCGYIIWAAGGGFTDIFVTLRDSLSASVRIPCEFTLTEIVRVAAAGLLILLLFMAVGTFIAMASDLRTRAHKIYIFMIWFLLVAAGGIFIPSSSIADLPIIAIPVSFIIPAFFVKHTGRVPAIIYMVTIITVAVLNILQLIY